LSTTAELVTAVRTQFGEDSTTDTAATDAQILSFLNRAMREICADSNILVSGWTASTVAAQQQYSVPPEYTSVERISIYTTTGTQQQQWLRKVSLVETDPRRPLGIPQRFAVWGLNVSGDNSPAFWLDPVPATSGTNDLICHGRQLPKTMVSGGQAPEVRQRWQDAIVDGALSYLYRRLGNSSSEAVALSRDYTALWRMHKDEAKLYIETDIYSAGRRQDTEGYGG
jgi:hypothetical protein